MSGGGGGGGSSNPAQGTTPYANAPTMQTFQPTLPGFTNSLASQLSRGFGSSGADLASLLSNLYQPMTAYQFKEPISATAAAYDKSKFAPISTGNPTLDQLLMGGGKADTSTKKK